MPTTSSTTTNMPSKVQPALQPPRTLPLPGTVGVTTTKPTTHLTPALLAAAVQPPQYQSEIPTPVTGRATNIAPLPSQQSSYLHDLASLALGYATPIAPGQVTQGQQQVLNAWQNNASADYSQYMLDQGLSAIAENPGLLFNEERLATQANWSAADVQSSMAMLRLSADDYDRWAKLETEKKKSLMGSLFGLMEIAGGVALGVTTGWTGVGLVGAGAMISAGGKQMASSDS